MNKKQDAMWHGILYFGLIVGAFAVYALRFNAKSQFLILMLIVGFYLIWGISYHSKKKDTTGKIIFEYFAISLIALGAGYLVLMS